MKTNKTVLCLDWSNLLFRALFINQLYGQNYTYSNIEDCRSFVYKFASDVCSIINIFKPNTVILLTDSQHAWRKDVYADYKKGREKDPNLNWDNIFKSSDDLKQIFKKAGCHIAEAEHAEADDMAALCKEIIFEKYNDHNLIIVSADADLRQLIDFNQTTNQYCAVYNSTIKGKTGKRFFYVNQEFMDWYNKNEQVDIFFSNMDMNKKYITDILSQNTKIAMDVENPNEILLGKIFCGDDGDNVPSFYSWDKDGKQARITPAKERKIVESLGIKNIDELLIKKDNLKVICEAVCKKELNDVNVFERLDRQRYLVELNSILFPDKIKDYKDSIDCMIQDETDKNFYNIKAADILKGTEYEGADKKKAIAADIFKDINKYGLNTIQMF